MSWYELAMYVEGHLNITEERKALEEAEWLRFRIQWADFRNVNRGKNGRVVSGKDLIHLSLDDRVPEPREIDMEAMKRKFGSKLKPRGK